MSDRLTAVVDLGLGNLRSVLRALERAGAAPDLVSRPEDVRRCSRLVVPGQGGFGELARAMSGGMGEAILEVIRDGRPYLGICLGMQMLFESSEEASGAPGLGVFGGSVRRFGVDSLHDASGGRLKVPHMGWNQVEGRHAALPALGWFYFVHSYYCEPRDESIVIATAQHGHRFCAAVARDNLFACQFHPEKSDHEGRSLLRHFLSRS